MRLFFDARYIRWEFHDGISRYSAELAAATAAAANAHHVELTFLIFDERQRAFLPAGTQVLVIHAPTSWREPFTALTLNRYEPDVVFSPMQTIGAIGRRYRLILTLHDMIYYRHRTPPRDLALPVRIGWRLFHVSYVPQRLTLNAADVVATVSETSKRQFAAVHLTKRPVVVIPNAPQRLQELLPGDVSVTAAGPATNLIYMGSFMPYKNVETLVRAMRLLPGRTLHLLSRISPERQAELEALAEGGTLRFHHGVSDAAYAAMLADRAVLVSMSLDEGYGLPLAEALELGVPAVVSDLEIFHEVAGDGALYVDPHDPAAVAAAVMRLDEPGVREGLVAAGTVHIAQFEWTHSADILLRTAASLAS